MRWVEKLRMRMQMLFRRRDAGAGLDYELRDHLERQIAENMVAGMSAKEARLAALREFGNPALLREQARATWSWNWLELIARDVRYGMRTLRRARGFSLVAVAVMALCIGAATSLFTIVRSVLLRPLPFHDPGQLTMVYERFRDAADNKQAFNYTNVAPGDYYDWRAKTNGFEDMAAWVYWKFNLSSQSGDLPETLEARAGTWNLFPLLGIEPIYGRSFTEEEDRPGGRAAMLTWNLFERRFGGDRSIVGKTIRLDGNPYTVVGVLPPSFTYPDAYVQIWVPFESIYGAGMVLGPEWINFHDRHYVHVMARLRPGVSLAAAVGQVEAVQYNLHLQYPNAPVAEDVVARDINEDLARDVKKPLMLLLGTVGCLLLIGSLNVANLLVARGAARQREVAIRSALGARRWTMIREQMTESLLISTAGGVAGVLSSFAATHWLASSWKNLPNATTIHVDMQVMLFSCGLVLLTAFLAGLLPVLSSTGKATFATLQSTPRASRTSLSRAALRKTLLTAEIAITVVLLMAAGLLLKSFMRLRTVNLGCATDNVLTMSYSLPGKKYSTPEKVNAFNEDLLTRVRALPGVLGAGLGFMPPGSGPGADDIFHVVEHPAVRPGDNPPDAQVRRADPGYFTALQIPLLNGRFFTSQDRGDRQNKVIVNRTLAEKYFPGESPIGKHIVIPVFGPASFEIVGEVGDTRYVVNEPPCSTAYFPMLAGLSGYVQTLSVRTAYDALAFSVPIQKQIATLDPGAAGLRCADDGADCRRLAGESEPHLHAGAGVCCAVAAACLGGAVRGARLPGIAENRRNRYSHRHGGKARAGFAPDVDGRVAARAGGFRAGACRQHRHRTVHPVDALWNRGAGSGGLLGGSRHAAVCGSDCLRCAGMAGIAAESGGGAARAVVRG